MLVAREAMESEACLVNARRTRSHGVRGLPSKCLSHAKPWISEACLVGQICMRSHGHALWISCMEKDFELPTRPAFMAMVMLHGFVCNLLLFMSQSQQRINIEINHFIKSPKKTSKQVKKSKQSNFSLFLFYFSLQIISIYFLVQKDFRNLTYC